MPQLSTYELHGAARHSTEENDNPPGRQSSAAWHASRVAGISVKKTLFGPPGHSSSPRGRLQTHTSSSSPTRTASHGCWFVLAAKFSHCRPGSRGPSSNRAVQFMLNWAHMEVQLSPGGIVSNRTAQSQEPSVHWSPQMASPEPRSPTTVEHAAKVVGGRLQTQMSSSSPMAASHASAGIPLLKLMHSKSWPLPRGPSLYRPAQLIPCALHIEVQLPPAGMASKSTVQLHCPGTVPKQSSPHTISPGPSGIAVHTDSVGLRVGR
mmetsp:Transcript_21914/g.65549  ORF Transcript_21914/g.65549 Transcript_21914/m.65549 type:complete len:264 (+) Transcript_21914:140-931(+)